MAGTLRLKNIHRSTPQAPAARKAEISTLCGAQVNVVVLYLTDARMLAEDWAPAIQMLQEQWQTHRQAQSEFAGKPLGGILLTAKGLRLYAPASADDGQPQGFEHEGRSEFPPLELEEAPEIFFAFLDRCLHGLGLRLDCPHSIISRETKESREVMR
ncbi:uncharacterized protein BP01DRAFT_384445 [Aspergillus saccharolyticus JOP 1030-1]|uniref:Uncharacterized protein n=1 Tax=Aspergillus saccharolyticus JOP 1030-1 TaxID=1450539 RepID=A0A319A8W0_9EURO|nr:hypothetical protein BP01DRAFT_384445 [Aspergillus saccharolyticus JOP 1030-1]PYH43512.1 hypothetical protein BP01DRAFT_384445 [Aspergillus saccharolyticus JOP 1030-1]